MTWQDDCDSPLSRYRASREDDDLNDAFFSVGGVVMKANQTILAMASPILKTLFYGSLAVKMGDTVTIHDGTERGFKAMLEFIYNEGEYSAKDLLGGKAAITEWEDLEKVLELIYFAYKYQINSLVTFGREILLRKIRINANKNVMKIHREIVSYKTTLNSEYSIVNYATKEFIGSQFRHIFKEAKVTAEVFLPEDMMVEMLKKKSLGNVTEGFVLQVALDYVRYWQDSEKKAKRKKPNPEDLAKRIITEVIDFTKLRQDEVDLTKVSAFLPPDVLLKMQTAMNTSYKNGLRDPVFRTENPEDYIISLAKTPLQELPASKTSQIKFKVDKSCFILFKVKRLDTHYGYYYGGYPNSYRYKQVVWKQSGSSKQVVTQQVDSHKFFADPNAEVTVDFEMNSNYVTFALDNDNGKFNQGDIELTVLEVNGEPIGEEVTGERANRGGKKKQDSTSNKGLHFVDCTIMPM